MLGIKEELLIFLIAVISGMIVRLAYRSLYCLRRMVHHSLVVIEIEDFLFWMASALYLFVQIYHTSDGRIRWYFALGVVFGVAISSLIFWTIEKIRKKIYIRNQNKSSGFLAKKNKKRYDEV